jgi:hypothetical protein
MLGHGAGRLGERCWLETISPWEGNASGIYMASFVDDVLGDYSQAA